MSISKGALVLPTAAELAIPSVFKALIAASNALARLDELAEVLDNPEVFVNAMPVIEAQASSEIENVVTTHDSIFRATSSPVKADPETLAALRLRKAITGGINQAKSRGISAKFVQNICSEIMGRQMPFRTLPGTEIRQGGKVVYQPPEPKYVAALMGQWEKFTNQQEILHPLLTMAISHYLLEAIHPFADGNGRTGRVINVLYLVATGELKQPVLHLSGYLNQHREAYYKKLRAVDRSGDWVGWVLFILEAVRASALDSAKKLKQMTELQLKFSENFYANADLVQLIFEKPYVQIGQVVDRCGVTRVTAAKWLESLVAQGALKSVVLGREKFFINQKLIRVLAN